VAETARERRGQLAESAGRRERSRAAAPLLPRPSCATSAAGVRDQAANDRAALSFGIDQGRKHGLGAEFTLVAGVDAGQERPHECIDQLAAEPAAHELGNGLAASVAARNERFAQQPPLARP